MELLKKRQNFWLEKLETLRPKGLNHELNQLFSTQLDYTPKCIWTSKVSEIEYSQRSV